MERFSAKTTYLLETLGINRWVGIWALRQKTIMILNLVPKQPTLEANRVEKGMGCRKLQWTATGKVPAHESRCHPAGKN